MNINLTATEARIIGSLMEKAITTPDQYPLSLNALVNACNQKSNRDPLMELDERTVQATLDALARKHLVVEKSGFGSRVPKYQHRLCNTGFGSLQFTPQETAILCELLLRGPQTPGELRTRASRMAEVRDVSEIESALDKLAAREDGPFVVKLPREAGRRDSRYAHLLSGEVSHGDFLSQKDSLRSRSEVPESESTAAEAAPELQAAPLAARVEMLEQLVAELRREVDSLKGKPVAGADS